MDPQVAAHRLTEIALLLEVRGENQFKVRAFVHAARTVQGLEEEDITPLVRSREISNLPGIGSTTLAVLSDLVETGDSEYLNLLRETTPAGLVEMLRVPGLGPTRIHKLHTGLGIETVAELEAAARDGHLAKLSGFGEKTAAKILRGIAVLRETSGKLLHSLAAAEAQRLRKAVGKLPGVVRVEIAGSIRRSVEVVRDIDLVVAYSGAANEVAGALGKVPGVQEVTGGGGPAVALRMINGARTDVYCGTEASFPIAFWRATRHARTTSAVEAMSTSTASAKPLSPEWFAWSSARRSMSGASTSGRKRLGSRSMTHSIAAGESPLDPRPPRHAPALALTAPAPILPGSAKSMSPGGALASTGVAKSLGACRGGSFPR